MIEWNKIAVDTIGAQPPFPSTRFMATVQVAVFEAVNAITKQYEPYLGTIAAPYGASPRAAAIAAAHGVLKAFFPAAAADLDAKRAASLAALPDGKAKTDGIAVGVAAAAAMVQARTGDGSAPPQFFIPTSTAPYEWQITGAGCPTNATTGEYLGGAFAHWKNVKPFGIQSSSQFRAPAPPAMGSWRYATDYNEVLKLGAVGSTARSQAKANVAKIYAAQPPHQGWNSVARQILSTLDDENISDTARTLALLNMSLSDAHITVFESKYHYRTWRPVTAIPRGSEDGNTSTAPASFTPFITTPCFPGYPSAHGVGAGAASAILAAAYGSDHELTNSHPSVPNVVLYYDDLNEIVRDVSDARVYGGIHFRNDQDAAERQGRAIATYNLYNVLEPD